MSDTAASAAPAAAPPEYSELQRWLALITVTLATTLYAMTVTIANVALPKMQGTFGATQDEIAWVVTFNIIATAVMTPATGWLAEKVGRRNVMIWGIALFTLVSAGCGLAESLEQLVFFRIMQGLAGAPLVPVSQAIVMTIFPRERHGTALAIWGIGVTIGPIIAPTLGGYVTELYNWRWIFFLLVPVGIVALLCAAAFVSRRAQRHPTTLDWTGFIALSLAIAALQLMLDRGERLGWFNHNEIILQAFVACLAFYVFVAHIFTTDHPFLQPRILTNRNFVIGLALTFVFGLLNFTPMVLFPS
ncbi:MAG: DHA2 family efflux MFS transporter permease subunit, partial [Alphaproteobacteria bacterium]|nr:DHA2 family efflux MFS transporter permease subunit [Alphaproteobacteria bacterium]